MANPLTLRVPDNLRTFLQQEAERRGQSVTQIVIAACWQYLEEPRDAISQKPELIPEPNAKPSLSDLRNLVAGIDSKYEESPMFGEPAQPMCAYTEYDTETGETYRCGRTVHGPKIKHTRGEKV